MKKEPSWELPNMKILRRVAEWTEGELILSPGLELVHLKRDYW